MENLYGCHYSSGYSEQPSMAPLPPPPLSPPLPPTSHHMISSITSTLAAGPVQLVQSGSSSSNAVLTKPCLEEEEEEEVSIALRAKVASHPLFPDLLDAYINCCKVGGPAEIAEVLDMGIRGESNSGLCQIPTSFLDADPELDDFMEKYCNLLVKFKSDLSRPFDEATAFLVDMETQLNNIICNSGPANVPAPADEATGTSEEDFNSKEEKGAIECKRMNEDRELKDKLLRRYSGYISSLKQEFSKKKKKEKLPREARQILLAWWNIHFKWPYPTEADKVALAEWTGLDQKQVNNWFINQRKRHWKPTEEMKGAVLDGLYGPLYMSESD